MYNVTTTENEFSSNSNRETDTYRSGFEVEATAKSSNDSGVTLPPTSGSGTTGPK